MSNNQMRAGLASGGQSHHVGNAGNNNLASSEHPHHRFMAPNSESNDMIDQLKKDNWIANDDEE